MKNQNYEQIKDNSWFVYDLKFVQECDNILNILNENLILKEHPYRNSIEKVSRKKLMKEIFD